MKGKKRNKFLAGFLAFVMVFLMLPMVPFTPAEAASAFADDADIIRLPITIRDANKDDLLFNGYDIDSEGGQLTGTLVNGVPAYNQATIEKLAGLIDCVDNRGRTDLSEINEDITNTDLRAILTNCRSNNLATWANTTSFSSNAANLVYLEDAKNAYDAAYWMLHHFFKDGQYKANASSTTFDKDKYFTKTYPGYESLVLQKGTYPDTGESCYFYSSNARIGNYNSNLQKTMFHYSNGGNTSVDEIYNSTANNATISANGGWFPLDGLGFNGKDYSNRNFFTTVAGNGQFVYHEADELFFAFTGDDDVYLFINGQLVVDNGGIHGEEKSLVRLENTAGTGTKVTRVTNAGGRTWAEYLGLEEGGIYDFHFFQMERNTIQSNFSMYTNINVVDSSAVPQKKVYQNGEELVYGSFVPQNSEVTYGFELTNNGGSNSSSIKNLTFVDSNLGVALNYTKDSSNNITYTLDYNQDGKQGAYPVNLISDLEWAVYANGTANPAHTKVKSEAELINLLKTGTVDGTGTGIPVGYTFSIRGFRYNVGAPEGNVATKTIANTVQTTCVGKANNSNTDRVIQGSATVRVRTWKIQNKTFVMDYAKKIEMTTAEVFGTELTELGQVHTFTDTDTANGKDVVTTIVLNSEVGNVTLDKNNGNYGTMVMNNDYSLEYTPTKVLNGIDSFIVKIKLDTTTKIGDAAAVSGSNLLNKSVAIVPANNVYYEDTFISNTGDSTVGIVYTGKYSTVTDGTTNGDTLENPNEPVHGWEENLADDTKYSDGTATEMLFEGSAATATFTFKGTGVDVYSRTNMDAGLVIASVTKEGETVATKSMMIDNYAASGDYYQIPTLSFNELDHDTYTLKLVVNRVKKKDANGNFIANEYRSTYWLDGIRVYNPIQDSEHTEVVKDAYTDAELNAVFTEVRDMLIDANNYVTDAQNTGVVFIDQLQYNVEGSGNADVNTELGLGVYEELGPKNEVYLAKGQSITFKVAGNSSNNYQLGLKAMSGNATTALVSNGGENSSVAVNHSTDLYYKVVPANGYITVQNSGDGLLSITKLKTTGEAPEVALLSITEEEAVAEVMAFSLRRSAPYVVEEEVVEPEVPGDNVTEPEVPGDDVTEPEEPEVPDVEIENPEPEKPQTSLVQVVLKQLVTKLFTTLIRWFGR